MEVKKKTYQIMSIILLVITVASIIFSVITKQHSSKVEKENSEKIISLKRDKADLNNQIKQLKSGNVKKYSADYLNSSSMNVKTNVDDFFKVINNWTGDNYATRSERAKKFATDEVVKLFVGGNLNKNGAKQIATQLKTNKTTKEIVESHWFIEKTNGENVNGLYIVSTVTSVQDSNKSSQQQLYRITYNILDKKIIKAQPVDLTNGSLDNLGK